MTQSWSGGYVADIPYVEGFYIQQSPIRMALACLLGNVAVDLPEPQDEAPHHRTRELRGLGRTVPEITTALGVSRRTVFRYLASEPRPRAREHWNRAGEWAQARWPVIKPKAR